jgi:beta-barrel assembly-enhancing protease
VPRLVNDMFDLARLTILFGVFAVGVAAVAAPKDQDIEAYRALVVQDGRLASVGYRLAEANAPFCKTKQVSFGWVLHDIAQYPDASTARAAFGFPEVISIAAIVPGGPADAAGIVAGDGIVAVNEGQWDWQNRDVKEGYSRLDFAKQQLQSKWQSQQSFAIPMNRKGELYQARVDAKQTCVSDFQIDPSAKFDAGADGKMVTITSAFAEYAGDETQLAAIVAHEMAHNILQHRAQLDALKVKRGVGRYFGKSKRATLATEIEADRLSIWLLANAGYDTDLVLAFWRQYGGNRGDGLFADGTHLGWRDRVAIMAQEAANLSKTPKVNGKSLPPLLNASLDAAVLLSK